jgi:hypothetical protein
MNRSINETGVAILLFFIIIIGSIAVSNYMQKARENSETSIQKQSEPSKFQKTK